MRPRDARSRGCSAERHHWSSKLRVLRRGGPDRRRYNDPLEPRECPWRPFGSTILESVQREVWQIERRMPQGDPCRQMDDRPAENRGPSTPPESGGTSDDGGESGTGGEPCLASAVTRNGVLIACGGEGGSDISGNEGEGEPDLLETAYISSPGCYWTEPVGRLA